MPNPTISFRLNKYQIARGLDIIRQHVSNYEPSSISQIVKLCYLDYLAKMGKDLNLNISYESAEKIKNMTTSNDPLEEVLIQMQTKKDKTEDDRVSSDDITDFFNNLSEEK